MSKVQKCKYFASFISALVFISTTLFSCSNPKNKLFLNHRWVVDTIIHKNNIIFSFPDQNLNIISNVILFKEDDFVRMPWINSATPNNGYWEIMNKSNSSNSSNSSNIVIKISQLPYVDFNGQYNVEVIDRGNGLYTLILKSDVYIFKCRTAI